MVIKMVMIENNDASVGIDLIFAIVLLMSAVMMAILIMPTLSGEDRDWRIKQYMVTTRATDNLVQDTGEEGWENSWKVNYSNITKIGFLYVHDDKKIQKVLDKTKIDVLMISYTDNQTGAIWWEFPRNDTSREERRNATRALGLEGYNFYMQLHPVGLNLFNSTILDANVRRVNGTSLDTTSVVDRYVYIIDPHSDDQIKYIKYDNEAVHYRLNIWVW